MTTRFKLGSLLGAMLCSTLAAGEASAEWVEYLSRATDPYFGDPIPMSERQYMKNTETGEVRRKLNGQWIQVMAPRNQQPGANYRALFEQKLSAARSDAYKEGLAAGHREARKKRTTAKRRKRAAKKPSARVYLSATAARRGGPSLMPGTVNKLGLGKQIRQSKTGRRYLSLSAKDGVKLRSNPALRARGIRVMVRGQKASLFRRNQRQPRVRRR